MIGNNKRRRVRAGTAEQVRVGWADSNGDHEGAENIEEAEADPDGVDGIGHRPSRVRGLCSDETTGLRARHGKDASRHDVKKALETVGEAVGSVPIFKAYRTALGCSASRDDNHGAFGSGLAVYLQENARIGWRPVQGQETYMMTTKIQPNLIAAKTTSVSAK